MLLAELKKLAKKLGGILVMNGDEPEFVVLSYGHYRKLEEEAGKKEVETSSEEKLIERLNTEILALKEEIRQREENELLNSEAGETAEV